MIKPDLWKNERLAELSPWHRLLFIGLWGLCDREGRLEDRPRRIQAEIFPYERDIDGDQLLHDLAASGFVTRYAVDERPYLWLPTFLKHQRPHISEPPSLIPPYDGTTEKSVLTTEKDPSKERKEKERKGKEREGCAALTISAPPNTNIAAEALLVFPTVGTQGQTWPLTVTQAALWAECYPNLDILAEARQALAWLHANPGRRKTVSGMPKFLVNWFNRSTNQGGGGPRVQMAGRPSVAESNLRGLREDLAELDRLERNP